MITLKEHIIDSPTENFIGGWFLEDLSICDRIIDYYSNSKHIERGQSYTIEHPEGILDTSVKDSFDCKLERNTDLFREYAAVQLQKVTEMYVNKFPMCDAYQRWGIVEGINIQKYMPGGAYHQWHTERGASNAPANNRHIVFMTYLNDVSDGGETEFFHQQVKVKPQKGLTLYWPSDWTYTHRGVPSITEEKFIITGWYSFY
jgi:hypothetical protein